MCPTNPKTSFEPAAKFLQTHHPQASPQEKNIENNEKTLLKTN
jgi:hypothetical protein